MATFLWILTVFITHTESQETFVCSDNWDTSICRHETITCGSEWNQCRMICLGEGSCDGTLFNCTKGVDCIVECRGYMSCRGTVSSSKINCPENNKCTILCMERSCEGMEINCPMNGDCIINATDISSLSTATINCPINGNCIINATGDGSLTTANILCPTINGECIVHCNGHISCGFAMIDARYSSKLDIYCKNQSRGCENIRIFCPITNHSTTQICSVSGSDQAEQDKLQIYAVNSWDDINMSGYDGIVVNTERVTPIMFCGEDYNELCTIADNVWNCKEDERDSVCFREDITALPTVWVSTGVRSNTPTMAPSVSEKQEEKSDVSEDWVLILLLILGFVVFIGIMIGLWFYCNKEAKKEEELNRDRYAKHHKEDKGKYEKIKTADNDDEKKQIDIPMVISKDIEEIKDNDRTTMIEENKEIYQQNEKDNTNLVETKNTSSTTQKIHDETM